MTVGKSQETSTPDRGQKVSADEKYGITEKLFGRAAERISREEYDAVVNEIIAKAGFGFKKLASPDQLTDKESFGDIDLVALADEEVNEDFLRRVFGDNLLEYHRGHVKTGDNYIYNTLIKLDSGKQVQVDFLRANDEDDFGRKHIFYSKGHLFPLLGIMARPLHFKCSDEGFFKRYKDSKGQTHHVLITADLEEGLQVLGYDRNARDDIKTLDDVVEFVASSPLFSGRHFDPVGMVGRHKEAVGRSVQQQWASRNLSAREKGKEITDEDFFFKRFFPEKYRDYCQETERIEREIRVRKAINGNVVMEALGLEPGPAVGAALDYLAESYPGIEELTPEIVAELRAQKA